MVTINDDAILLRRDVRLLGEEISQLDKDFNFVLVITKQHGENMRYRYKIDFPKIPDKISEFKKMPIDLMKFNHFIGLEKKSEFIGLVSLLDRDGKSSKKDRVYLDFYVTTFNLDLAVKVLKKLKISLEFYLNQLRKVITLDSIEKNARKMELIKEITSDGEDYKLEESREEEKNFAPRIKRKGSINIFNRENEVMKYQRDEDSLDIKSKPKTENPEPKEDKVEESVEVNDISLLF